MKPNPEQPKRTRKFVKLTIRPLAVILLRDRQCLRLWTIANRRGGRK